MLSFPLKKMLFLITLIKKKNVISGGRIEKLVIGMILRFRKRHSYELIELKKLFLHLSKMPITRGYPR